MGVLDTTCKKKQKKKKKLTPPSNFRYSEYVWYQVSAQTNNFNFLDQIC